MYKTILLTTAIGLLLVTGVTSCTTIREGERGVKITLGKASNEALETGIAFKVPLIQSIKKFDIKIKKMDDKTVTYTKDIQPATVEYTVNYSLQPSVVVSTYKNYGTDWEDRILKQLILNYMKDVIGKWNAVDLIQNRENAALEITGNLSKALNEKGIILSSFSFRDIDFGDNFEKAIEAKVIATQRSLESQQKTVQIQEEAKQRIISAEAEAKSIQIKSEALTKNPVLIQYDSVQKWNGVLPTTMTGNAVPFINIK